MPATPIPRRGPQNAFTRRLAKLSDWELTSLFSRPYTNPYPRKVLVNVHVPPEAYTTAPKLPLWSTTVERDDLPPFVQTRVTSTINTDDLTVASQFVAQIN